jgi:SHS2 domain-containing protein
MKKYKFLPNIATADIAFEAYGENHNELFENAALALQETMVDVATLSGEKEKSLELESKSLEDLLYLFLDELVFLKDAEQLVFNKINCSINKVGGKFRLKADLFGNKLDFKKHEPRDDVKAVTKHLFKINKLSDKSYKCLVVLDV